MRDMELEQTPGGSESSIPSWYSSFTLWGGTFVGGCFWLHLPLSALTINKAKKKKVNCSSAKIFQEY